MKIKMQGFVYQSNLCGEPYYSFFRTGDAGDEYYALVGPAEFDFEVPDNFDPRKSLVASMTAKIEEIQAEATMQVTRLQGRINELLAIENTAELEEA